MHELCDKYIDDSQAIDNFTHQIIIQIKLVTQQT